MPDSLIDERTASHPYLIAGVLGGAMAVATVAATLVGVLAPYLLDEITGLTPINVGLLVTTFAVVSGTMAWPAGALTDRIGGRTALILVFAGSVLGLGFLSLATTFGILVAAMAVAGVSNSAVNPATNRAIARWVAPGKRGVVAGIKMAAVQVAVFIAGIFLPLAAETIGWRVPLVASGLLLATLGTAGALAFLRGTDVSDAARLGGSGPRWSASLTALTIYSVFMSAGASSTVTYISLFTVEGLGSTPRVGGFAVAAIGFLAIAGRLVLGRIAEQWPRPMRSLTFVALLAAASATILLLADSANSPLYWMGTVGLGLSALSFVAGTTVALITSTHADEIGGFSGVMFAGFMVGFGGGPAAFGAVLDASGSYALGWTLVTGLFGAAIVTAWVGWRLRVIERADRQPAPRGRHRSARAD